MRSLNRTGFFRLFSLAAVLAALLGCSEDEAPAHAELNWKLRCDTGCGLEHDAQHVNHFDGEAGYQVSCRIDSVGDGQVQVDFAVGKRDAAGDIDFALKVDNAVFSAASGVAQPGGDCSVEVVDEINKYRGSCGPSTPNPEQPCRLAELMTSGGTLTGTLECDGLQFSLSRDELRQLASAEESGMPVMFTFENCE